jgi:hypothetical protein
MALRTGHERRTDMYARAKARPKSFNKLPSTMQVRSISKAAGLTSAEDVKTLRKTVSNVRRFAKNDRIISPKQSEALLNQKPGTNGNVMTTVSKTPYTMGYGVTQHHKSGGSSSGGVYGNRNPVHIANDILKGADRSAMSTWKD